MTTQQRFDLVPEWTMGDRLRKARTLTGMTVREFAGRLGVSHGTVTNAETDARAVRKITLRAWANETGVSLEWLETGVGTAPTPPPDGGGRRPDSGSLAELTDRKRNRQRTTGEGVSTRRYVASAA